MARWLWLIFVALTLVLAALYVTPTFVPRTTRSVVGFQKTTQEPCQSQGASVLEARPGEELALPVAWHGVRYSTMSFAWPDVFVAFTAPRKWEPNIRDVQFFRIAPGTAGYDEVDLRELNVPIVIRVVGVDEHNLRYYSVTSYAC